MIGKLSGRVDEVGEDFAIIDVGGVGYVVACSARTLRRLPETGGAARLIVETVLREDLLKLFGFIETAERDWFRILQTVQGVGTRVALAILDTLGPDDLARAILTQDKAALGRASGVGPKLALRLIIELKDKVPSGLAGLAIGAASSAPTATPATGQGAAGQGVVAEAVSALINLGYKPGEASGAIAAAQGLLGLDADLSTLIRTGLRELAR